MTIRELREKLNKISEKEDDNEMYVDVDNKVCRVKFANMRNFSRSHESHRGLWIVGGEKLYKG